MPPKRKGSPLYKGMPDFDDPQDHELADLMNGLNMVSKMPRFDTDISDDALNEVLDKVEAAVKRQKRKREMQAPMEWYYGYKPYHVKRRKGSGEPYYELEYSERKEWFQRVRPMDTTQIIKY